MDQRINEQTKMSMFLSAERLIVRNLMETDADDLFETLSDEAVMKYIEPPFDMEKTKKFIREAGLCEPPLVYALEWKETGKVIGHVIFHPYEEDSYEIGWILNRRYWGKGIADEITKILVEHAKKLQSNSCVIECDERQVVSKHIAWKNGFVYEREDDGCSVYRLKM